MSKELEAFSRITLHTDFDNDGSYDIEKFEDDCKGVEEALQKLDDIKNSKQSEAMECFKRVWNDINGHNDFRQDFKDLTNIENYILKAQEQEKVINELKTLIKYADLNKQRIISLAVLKNALKEVL